MAAGVLAGVDHNIAVKFFTAGLRDLIKSPFGAAAIDPPALEWEALMVRLSFLIGVCLALLGQSSASPQSRFTHEQYSFIMTYYQGMKGGSAYKSRPGQHRALAACIDWSRTRGASVALKASAHAGESGLSFCTVDSADPDRIHCDTALLDIPTADVTKTKAVVLQACQSFEKRVSCRCQIVDVDGMLAQ